FYLKRMTCPSSWGKRSVDSTCTTGARQRERCFFFQAEDGIRDRTVTGVQTCALPILRPVSATVLGSRGMNVFLTCCCGGASSSRSEERRVGKECRSRWGPEHDKKKKIESSQ